MLFVFKYCCWIWGLFIVFLILQYFVRNQICESKDSECTKIEIKNSELILSNGNQNNFLKNKEQFIGFTGIKDKPNSILIKNNNLHLDIIIDSSSMIGSDDKANISAVPPFKWLTTAVKIK